MSQCCCKIWTTEISGVRNPTFIVVELSETKHWEFSTKLKFLRVLCFPQSALPTLRCSSSVFLILSIFVNFKRNILELTTKQKILRVLDFTQTWDLQSCTLLVRNQSSFEQMYYPVFSKVAFWKKTSLPKIQANWKQKERNYRKNRLIIWNTKYIWGKLRVDWKYVWSEKWEIISFLKNFKIWLISDEKSKTH